VNLSGGTSATYKISAAKLTDAGTYNVVVSNAVGSVTSVSANLVVNEPLSITSQPMSMTVNPDAPATFSVSVTGSGPITYQWKKGTANVLTGGTAASLSFTAARAADAGTYTVAVTNPVGSVTSGTAVLRVNTPASITTQPVGRLVLAGGSVELKVVAAGSAPLNYQWSKDGTVLTGATADVYRIQSVQAVDAGSYTVTVSNMVNSVTSTPAEVSLEQAPTIQTQPSSLTVNPGTLVTLSVSASGTAPLRYQWQREGVNLSGGTSSSYVIASAKATDAGTYTVVVSNNAGSVTSAPAVLGLNTPAAITTNPLGATLLVGTLHTLRVAATGTAPLSYQWYQGDVAIPGGTQDSYTLQSAQLSDSGTYTVKVSNMVNSVTSIGARVVVADVPSIVTQPSSLTVNPGTLVTFSVAASGTIPLTYQWQKEGVNLSGGTSATYKISAAKVTDTGTYNVVVSNAVGSVKSVAANLVVNEPLSITSQPMSLTVNPDAPATFSVSATGSGPITYQWKKGAANVTNGGTAASLSFTAAQRCGRWDIQRGGDQPSRQRDEQHCGALGQYACDDHYAARWELGARWGKRATEEWWRQAVRRSTTSGAKTEPW
jgi:plastocyanin